MKLAAWPSLVAIVACTSSPPTIRSVTGTAQGTTYSLQWLGGADEAAVAEAAEIELERLDALLSNYREDSLLERVNAARTVDPIEIPAELGALLEIASDVHAASGGCFDPTVRPLVRAWGFDGDTPAPPSATALAEARARVGFEKLAIIDRTHVRKTVPGVEIDMASIGQGYTAERLARLLESLGSTAYLAEIGGEIVARGVKPDGARWRVGVENPVDLGAAGPTLRLPGDRRAVAVITSGSYRQYVSAGARRLGHVFDPRSGQPVDHSLWSATVVGHDAATAAAWATALLCLGPTAEDTANRHGIAALLWTADSSAPAPTGALSADWGELLAADDAP